MTGTQILEVDGLTKQYESGATKLTVLKEISFSLAAGGACAIVGPSGSGKTTLLGLCAGLDTPTAGSVRLDGIDLHVLNEDQRARIRNQKVGFVFQNFQLIPTLTALENVAVPLELQGAKDASKRASELLGQVGLSDRVRHYPAQLSGGEQQRVAIARAFVTRPQILFADEPTGNLDADTAETVVRLLFEMNRSFGTALVLVTHNLELAERAEQILRLKGGALIERRAGAPRQEVAP